MPPAHSGGRATPDLGPGGRVVARARAIPDRPLAALLRSRGPPRVCWAARDGIELAGVGAAVEITATGADRFETVRSAATRLFEDVDHQGPAATRPRLFGGFAFDAGGGAASTGDGAASADAGGDSSRPVDGDSSRHTVGDSAGPSADSSRADADVWPGFPPARFVLPELQLVRTDERTWLVATEYGRGASAEDVEARLDEAEAALDAANDSDRSAVPGVERTRIRPDRERWTAAVDAAIDRIEAGELRKLVLATAMDVDLAAPADVPAALERFRETYPDCYRVLVQPGEGGAFFGPPPERLVALRDGTVRTEALAGSIGRGETPAEDEERAAELRADEKRQHEQQLVVDAVRERLSAFGEVVEHEQTVRRLATIQHLRTPITATLDEPTHVLDLVAALHPTPAVGGLPRDRAMAAIRELESFDRGWYAGPVGWVDAAGDGEFAVAIRTGVVDGRRARLFAGNGIVADSDPDAEWAEIRPKFRPVLDELS